MDAPNLNDCDLNQMTNDKDATAFNDSHQTAPVHLETYFNAGSATGTTNRASRQHRYAYDNFVYANLPFDCKAHRGDRVNVDERFRNIHAEELAKTVPMCSQSWYGHRKAKYDERMTGPLGKVEEMKSMERRNGMPFPKPNTFGMEQVDNRTLIDVVKPRV